MNKTIQVRVLYSQGCPNLTPTINIIERVGTDIGIPYSVETIMITSQEEAVELHCFGSPTVQVNGLDIEPAARESVAFGLGWRNYGASGMPSEEVVRDALLNAVHSGSWEKMMPPHPFLMARIGHSIADLRNDDLVG